MMNQCVLFDLDGTLIDTWHLYIECYLRTLKPHYGRLLALDELIALELTSERRLLNKVFGKTGGETAFRTFIDLYDSLHEEYCDGFYDGIIDMLSNLIEKKIKCGIVTGKSKPAWEITRRRLRIGHFDVVITDDDVEQAKPNPEGITRALAELGMTYKNGIYIGDSAGDFKAAVNAGIRFGAVLWSKTEQEKANFRREIPGGHVFDFLAAPRELTDIINSLS